MIKEIFPSEADLPADISETVRSTIVNGKIHDASNEFERKASLLTTHNWPKLGQASFWWRTYPTLGARGFLIYENVWEQRNLILDHSIISETLYVMGVYWWSDFALFHCLFVCLFVFA